MCQRLRFQSHKPVSYARRGSFCLVALRWGEKHQPSAAVGHPCRGLSSKRLSSLAAFSLTLTAGLGGDLQPFETDKFLQPPLPLFEIVFATSLPGKEDCLSLNLVFAFAVMFNCCFVLVQAGAVNKQGDSILCR